MGGFPGSVGQNQQRTNGANGNWQSGPSSASGGAGPRTDGQPAAPQTGISGTIHSGMTGQDWGRGAGASSGNKNAQGGNQPDANGAATQGQQGGAKADAKKGLDKAMKVFDIIKSFMGLHIGQGIKGIQSLMEGDSGGGGGGGGGGSSGASGAG